MIIRKIQPTDNKALAKMIRNVFEEHNAPKEGTVYSDPSTDYLYELFEATEKSVLWVAELNDEVVGCCGMYPTEGLPNGCVELVKLYLSNAARGKGIGKALLEKSMESAKKLGYSEVYLESLPIYKTAVNMYKKQGFISLEKPLGNTGHTSCNIWMLKKL